MIPPEAPEAGDIAGAAETPPAVSVCVEVLRRRADFLRAARARRHAAPGFVLQARRREPDEPDGGLIRVGFTCSKKVGNSVARNRARRRLREIARQALPRHGRPGWDYVLIGRSETTATHPFARILGDLEAALDRVHGPDREAVP